ncbi:dual OB domain-containing protein [Dysgonomonas reticulitermitis]
MDVLIISKTKMLHGICVGGLLANGLSVRLLNANGYNQDINTEFNVGDVYTISYIERTPVETPHVEDILVINQQFKFKFNTVAQIISFIKEKSKLEIWKGNIKSLFNGSLHWTKSGSGYISKLGSIPSQSTGFWITDKDLIRNDYGDKIRYVYHDSLDSRNDDLWSFAVDSGTKYISFVGLQEAIDKIPAGTLVRVSLARWWNRPNSEDESRCYLQLSGWYNI